MELSTQDYVLRGGALLDFILIALGISFTSIKLNDPSNTTFTPTLLLILFSSAVLLTSVLLWFSDLTHEAILYTFAIGVILSTLLTYSSLVVRMRFYA
jgi:hypothetical protein